MKIQAVSLFTLHNDFFLDRFVTASNNSNLPRETMKTRP